MNVVKEIKKLNEAELDLALAGKASWHDAYKDSAYIFVVCSKPVLFENIITQI